MAPLLKLRRLPVLTVVAVMALGAGVATAVTLPPRNGRPAAELVPIPGPTGGVKPTGGPRPGADPDANDHGQEVSAVAHDDSLHGCEKGAAVSEVASSKAAEHRQNEPKPHPCEDGAEGGTSGPGGNGHGHAYGHDKGHENASGHSQGQGKDKGQGKEGGSGDGSQGHGYGYGHGVGPGHGASQGGPPHPAGS